MDKPKALTIKELKKMIGKPVFVVWANRKEWCIIHSFNVSEIYGGGIIVTTRTSQKKTLPYHEFCIFWRAYDKEWMYFEDPAPVVRCKDCIYSRPLDRKDDYEAFFGEDSVWCAHRGTAEYGLGFCSLGERDEDEKI